jgi:Mrp family chromosome partitioning ATPase
VVGVNDDQFNNDHNNLERIKIVLRLRMTNVIDGWTHEVERIALATIGRGIRSVGITSPGGHSGVSTLAADLAEVTALSGVTTLFVDLTASVLPNARDVIWRPGEGGAGQAIVRDPRGFDVLTAKFDVSTRFLFNNVERLKQSLGEELVRYNAIIVDIPALCVPEAEHINGAAAAAACDGVLLVCVSGRITRAELIKGASALTSAKANVLGTVLNDIECPTLGAEIAREARRLEQFAPRFAKWVSGKALNSSFLNAAAA